MTFVVMHRVFRREEILSARVSCFGRDDQMVEKQRELSEYGTGNEFEWSVGDGSVKQIAQAEGKPLSSGRNFP